MIVQENEPSRMILLDKGFDSLVQWLEQDFGSTRKGGGQAPKLDVAIVRLALQNKGSVKRKGVRRR